VHVQFASALLDRDLLLHGDDEQAGWVPEPELEGMRWADVYVGLRGMRNPYELEDVPADRLRARRRTLGVVSAERTPQRGGCWCACRTRCSRRRPG
jgi:aminopeptidase